MRVRDVVLVALVAVASATAWAMAGDDIVRMIGGGKAVPSDSMTSTDTCQGQPLGTIRVLDDGRVQVCAHR